MPAALPEGEEVPAGGLLPVGAAAGAEGRTFGVYVHVPFCAVRCGYCDFNTYTATELGGGGAQALYAETAAREITWAAGVLERSGLPSRPASTVFFGGGTPTLLPARDLIDLLGAVRDSWGLAPGCEVTVEANPESVTASALESLAEAGVSRISVGMQSAVPEVLSALDRAHDPRRVPQVVRWARDAGLAVSLDLIYGTPGETVAAWGSSVESALACEPDHLSAYPLVVEEGTRLAARVRRGELPAPQDDDLAEKYELADDLLDAAGLHWYEISNWSRGPREVCRHNVAYWEGGDWWGVGPGAHSHVGGVRWWNVRHPSAYAARLGEGASPAAGREVLDAAQCHTERMLLGVRMSGGVPLETVEEGLRWRVAGLVADGLLDGRAAVARRVVLTRRGRLLADTVVRALLP